MRKYFLIFTALLLLFSFNQKVYADCTFEKDGRTIAFVEDELKFYENSKELSVDEVKNLFPDWEVITIKYFDKNKKYILKNRFFKKRHILLLNDTPRTFHLFEIYPETARVKYGNLKEGEIKSLILLRGKKNVRLKHAGGDEFEIVAR